MIIHSHFIGYFWMLFQLVRNNLVSQDHSQLQYLRTHPSHLHYRLLPLQPLRNTLVTTSHSSQTSPNSPPSPIISSLPTSPPSTPIPTPIQAPSVPFAPCNPPSHRRASCIVARPPCPTGRSLLSYVDTRETHTTQRCCRVGPQHCHPHPGCRRLR